MRVKLDTMATINECTVVGWWWAGIIQTTAVATPDSSGAAVQLSTRRHSTDALDIQESRSPPRTNKTRRWMLRRAGHVPFGGLEGGRANGRAQGPWQGRRVCKRGL